MRCVRRSAIPFFLVLGTSIAIGCSESSTGPGNDHPSTGMEHIWSKSFGDGSYQTGEGIAVDYLGNITITGSFGGVLDFGGDALNNPNNYDVFVARFGSDGSHAWSDGFGDAPAQVGKAVAVDGDGNVIITGYFESSVDFGGGPLVSAGYYDIFLAKFDADGNYLWSKRFGDSDSQIPEDVAVDASGDVIITGSFGGTVDFGGGPLTSGDQWDIFVAKFDADGNHLWSKKFGDFNEQHGQAVAVDPMSNVIIVGNYGGTVNFGGGPIVGAGSYDIYIAKFSADGTHLWSKSIGDASEQHVNDVATDAFSNVIITGEFNGDVDFGGGAVVNPGSWNIYVAKYGSDGSYAWDGCFGDSDEQFSHSVAIDASGNIIITGDFEGTVDFGGGTLTSAGDLDIFIAQFDSDGSHLWSDSFGDASRQEGHDIAAEDSGEIIVTGLFYGTVDFGGSLFTSAGNYDIYVVKFGP